MASVSFHHVGKRFGDLVAVQDFDLHIEDKEFVILVGPSGCGKSTTLRMLAGLEKITEGKIQIDGRVVEDIYCTSCVMMEFVALNGRSRTLHSDAIVLVSILFAQEPNTVEFVIKDGQIAGR